MERKRLSRAARFRRMGDSPCEFRFAATVKYARQGTCAVSQSPMGRYGSNGSAVISITRPQIRRFPAAIVDTMPAIIVLVIVAVVCLWAQELADRKGDK